MEIGPTKSYKDKLLGTIPGAFAHMCTANSQHYEEEDLDSEVDEFMERVAKVKLSKETKARIRGAWGNALIVKVFGKSVGFHYLHRMSAFWRLVVHWRHFVAVWLWEPNFKASTAKVNTEAVWVRLNELPVEYYDATVLWEIGNAIGPVLKIDAKIASGT
ncbi:hypothetical protein SO802_026224 [Lithocarpus litseifolius]|uniref:DUF4283 domain-containing protein n=1 Tax=Lithocarpus litseifolius TaxID=425828 RepID=A0AAW2BZ44_9ROSI